MWATKKVEKPAEKLASGVMKPKILGENKVANQKLRHLANKK
jgi:hypothetical protein